MEEDERSTRGGVQRRGVGGREGRGGQKESERTAAVAGGGDGRGLSLAKPALRVAWSRYVELIGR